MPLSAGTRLGSYEILSALGAGGMGEVYRARDTRLDRDVAIKILPVAFVADAERVARFLREAKVLASLNHPHIAAIYGLENADGVKALVMELVEGENLAQRLARGAIPVDEALPIAAQIAEALEAAHEQGIIHRDLKPANINLRPDGTVKVLDFGLAKALEPVAVTGGDLTASPTITSPALTQMGVILGTAAYMSPEQAKGRAADKRSDLWAFGCVLYEMLTANRVFRGDGVSDTLAAVLRGEPDWSALPVETPAPIRRLLRRCLVKDLKGRIADASIARIEIGDVQSGAHIDGDVVQKTLRRRERLIWVSALVFVALVTAGVMAWMRERGSVPSLRLARFTITLARGEQFSRFNRAVAVSPDGTTIVYTANQRLHLRAMDRLESVPIPGTENTGTGGGGESPFFSPDGQWIGFWQRNQFKKVSITGGAPLVLCSAQSPRGATWTTENTILYGQGAEGIWSVTGDGGKPENLVKVDAGQFASGPQMLPGGRAILFTLAGKDPDPGQIVIQSLDTGMRHVVLDKGTDARYLPTGHLVYALGSTLLAVPFDMATFAVTGGPVPLVEDVARPADGILANFAVSTEGTLVYVPRDAVALAPVLRTLVWVDRQGREAPIKAPPRAYVWPRLSPDGTRVALSIAGQESDIWVWDLVRQTATRLTFGPAFDMYPVWTPDGQSVIFSSGVGFETSNLFRRAAAGTGTVEQLTQATIGRVYPTAVTQDGKWLIYSLTPPAGGTAGDQADLMLLPLVGDRRPQPLVQTAFTEGFGEISPDGRWLAYQSNATGQFEIYVTPFPNVTAGKWQVSTSGGTQPLWARNGQELFYESMGALMRVPLTSRSTFAAGPPSKLFDMRGFLIRAPGRLYDIAPDGRRFLMTKTSRAADAPAPSARLILVQHWFEELKRRAPTH